MLDLDGDGIELFVAFESVAFFDLNADGMATHAGWVAPYRDLLAIDRISNGIIDDGTGSFGNTNGFSGGFQSLNSYDSNLDGAIDASDDAFGDFAVWRDLDGDGHTDPVFVDADGAGHLVDFADADRGRLRDRRQPDHRRGERSNGLNAAVDALTRARGVFRQST